MSPGGDGAHMGVDAERALETVLGGADQPSEEERADKRQTRARILEAAGRGGEPRGYGDCADVAAGMLLRYVGRHPEAFPTDELHALYEQVDAFTEGKLGALQLTGFMWGWAVNTVNWLAELPPQPNPAIVEIPGGPS